MSAVSRRTTAEIRHTASERGRSLWNNWICSLLFPLLLLLLLHEDRRIPGSISTATARIEEQASRTTFDGEEMPNSVRISTRVDSHNVSRGSEIPLRKQLATQAETFPIVSSASLRIGSSGGNFFAWIIRRNCESVCKVCASLGAIFSPWTVRARIEDLVFPPPPVPPIGSSPSTTHVETRLVKISSPNWIGPVVPIHFSIASLFASSPSCSRMIFPAFSSAGSFSFSSSLSESSIMSSSFEDSASAIIFAFCCSRNASRLASLTFFWRFAISLAGSLRSLTMASISSSSCWSRCCFSSRASEIR